MTIRALVFDFDGVLIDSNQIKAGLYFDIFSDHRESFPAIERILQQNQNSDRFQIIDLILKEVKVTEGRTAQAFAADYTRICEQKTSECQAGPGVLQVLPMLAKQLPLFIDSDTPEQSLQRVVKNRGWNNFFKGVYGRPHSKEENLLSLLEKNHWKPSDVLFVGDRQRDYQAATQVGTPFVGMRSDGNNFLQNVVLLDNFQTLVEFLNAKFTNQEVG